MKQYSRTENSVKNTYVSVLLRMAAILMGFLTRVVFTHTLSQSYVGINGLFLDILNVLSLSELGVETAITYTLYRPIAEQNIEQQKSLMQAYRRYYRIVAAAVAAAGLALLPLLDTLIKNKPDVAHLTVIYLLYLCNSCLSYLLIYKKTLIDAHQLYYIGVLYQTSFWLLQDMLQIIVLLCTKNFILFLIVYILCTLGSNLCISAKANQLYPFLKDRSVTPLSQPQEKAIFRNVRALFMHKIGRVAMNNTDNLILSAYVGIVGVGYYSNYFLIIKSISQIVEQVFQGIAASVGNLGATEAPQKVRLVYESTTFVAQWMYGVCAICLYEMINPFVEISFGENYLFAKEIVLVLCICFFISGLKDATLVFRDSLGLFWFDRYIALAESGVNLLLSIVLVKQFGTIGVFLGTLLSMLCTSVWLEPFVLYQKYLHASSKGYYLHYVGYIAAMGGIWWMSDFLCSHMRGSFWVLFCKKLFICVTVPNILLLCLYMKTQAFQFVWRKACSVWKHRKKRV